APASESLVTAARTAFTTEVHVGSMAGAVVMALAAVFALATLRSVKNDTERSAELAAAPQGTATAAGAM
ncbi:MFS transporter, partial [Streptomyces carpinensis]